MAKIGKKPIRIMGIVLRDAHQSLTATRMTTEQILPIVDKMDKVDYHAVEHRGGTTFDVSLHFLEEDPRGRPRKLRAGFKNTRLQVLFRRQSILDYSHYTDDVVEYFVQKSIANGTDVIRVFDCLNDIRSLETAVKACNKEKGETQTALCYTLGGAYILDYWKDITKGIEGMGADPLCTKSMAGPLVPYKTEKLVGTLKAPIKLPIDLHTHHTPGVASMTYLKAVEPDYGIIDTVVSSFALDTSQPTTKAMVETLRGTPYDTGSDQNLLAEIVDYFAPTREEVLKNSRLNPRVLGVNIKTSQYRAPGGMLPNLIGQLKEVDKEDKYREVLEEIPRVRKDFGEPPLVTPSPQVVDTRAVMNVVSGERYKTVPKESKKIMFGELDQTVKPFSPEVQKEIISGETPITRRPVDLIPPQLPQLGKECVRWKQQNGDVLSYALFPKVAEEFFKYGEAQRTKVDPAAVGMASEAYPI